MGEEKAPQRGDEEKLTGSGSRRTFLQTMGAVSALAGAGLAGAQETTEKTPQGTQTTTTTAPTPIVLGGRVASWRGLAPAPIEGNQNPPLRLREGQQYRLVWINLDGKRHEFLLEDGKGKVIAQTEAANRIGGTRSVTFTADPSLAGYRCEYHPKQMQGSVELGNGSETTATETTESGRTTTTGGGQTTDVAVGPEGQYLKFVPEEVTISVGETVRWTAKSEGHNVSAKPEADQEVQLPQGAEPFATYNGNRSFMVMQVGDTFEQTFTVPGTYVYVCVPHADQGMIGRVIVNG